ncbi:DUF2268 domain-containing protein [Alkalihalobacillus sp. NPDC078783]
MSVVRTDKWIRYYLQEAQQRSSQQTLHLSQKKWFVEPLVKRFDGEMTEQLHPFLLEQGLFLVNEQELEDLEELATRPIWEKVQTQFLLLKKEWDGPDLPIYLLPVNKGIDDSSKKAGISFPFALFLFVGTHLSDKEIHSLLVHEYHHAVRLMHSDETEESISLLESIYMEGLAELAVLEYVGEDQLAPWTSLYDERFDKKWFKKWVAPNLNVKGRSAHRKYLYGDARLKIPPLLGYYVGYQLAKTSHEKRPAWTTTDWLTFKGPNCKAWLKEVLKSMSFVE